MGKAGRINGRKGTGTMGRIIKGIVVLALLGFVGLAGYAYLGDLAPAQQEIRVPVTLDGG